MAGMNCETCGTALQVVDSRSSEFLGRPTIRRKRACPKCKTRFTTYEVKAGDMTAAASAINDVIGAVRAVTSSMITRGKD